MKKVDVEKVIKRILETDEVGEKIENFLNQEYRGDKHAY